MAESDNQELIRVFENGSGGGKYKYDIRTEPATVIITVHPPVNDSDISSGDDTVANSAKADSQSQPKRRKIDSTSNADSAKSDREQIFHVMRGEENVCTRGIDQGKGREELQRSSSLSKSKLSQAAEPNSNNEDENTSADEWTQDLGKFPFVPAFTGEDTVHIDREEGYSVFSCFKLFFTDWLLNHLHKQTNKYADDLRAINIDDLDRDGRNMLKEWKTMSLTEMKGFILILIHMGAVRKKYIEDYWCQDTFIASPFASQVLCRSRFRSIYNMFHMNDNHTYIPAHQPNHDPLHKIRPVYDHLKERFQAVYTPSKTLAIHEAMSLDPSTLSTDQQQNSKGLASSSNSSTLKLYALSDCGTGYMYNFEIIDLKSNNSSICCRKPSKMALQLMTPLLHKGYHLFTAESVTCPVLFKTLTESNTMCTGLVHCQKDGMPKDLVDEDFIMAGQIAFRRKDKLCAVKWNSSDGKINEGNLFMLTSAHHPLETGSRNENLKHNNNSVTVGSRSKPVCVNEFNKNMSAVFDHTNQVMEFVPLTQLPSKWPKRVFLQLLTHCIKQAMIVYNKFQSDKGGKILSFPLFVKALGRELSDEFISERGQPVPSLYIASLTDRPNTLIRTDHSHFHHLVPLPANVSLARKPRKSCRVCVDIINRIHESSDQHIRIKFRRTVSYWCAVCKVSLCMDPCFYLYHNEGDYITAGTKMEFYQTLAAEHSGNFTVSYQADFEDD